MSESLITIRAIKNNPCRDIVEGRRRPAPVQTVPFREFTLTPPDRSSVELPSLDPHQLRTRTAGGIYMEDAFEHFRASNPGEFTARLAAEHVIALGWRGRSSMQCVNREIRKHQQAGTVMLVREINTTYIWKFTDPAQPSLSDGLQTNPGLVVTLTPAIVSPVEGRQDSLSQEKAS